MFSYLMVWLVVFVITNIRLVWFFGCSKKGFLVFGKFKVFNWYDLFFGVLLWCRMRLFLICLGSELFGVDVFWVNVLVTVRFDSLLGKVLMFWNVYVVSDGLLGFCCFLGIMFFLGSRFLGTLLTWVRTICVFVIMWPDVVSIKCFVANSCWLFSINIVCVLLLVIFYDWSLWIWRICGDG